jgi:hypothetical protein
MDELIHMYIHNKNSSAFLREVKNQKHVHGLNVETMAAVVCWQMQDMGCRCDGRRKENGL